MVSVLQVIDRLEIGGAERVLLDLTFLLRNEGVNVDVLTISGKGQLDRQIDRRCKRYYLNRKRKYSISKIWECYEICRNYSVVHVHMRHTYAYIRLVQFMLFGKFKIVFHDHFGDIDKTKTVPFSLRFLFKPKYYIGVSESLSLWASNELKIPKNRIWTLRNTIIPMDCNGELFAASENNIILISNIRRTKKIDFAIDLALKYDLKLDVYGNVMDLQYGEILKEKIRFSNHIRIISGVSDIQPLLKNYRLAIHTAESESGPLVLLEYLANGIPFLAYGTGEIFVTLKSKYPQYFINNYVFDNWYNRINQIENSEVQSNKLKGIFRDYFGPNLYIKQCMDIYHQVIVS